MRLKHKFKAQPTTRTWKDGSAQKFDSKKEAKHCDNLELAKSAGTLVFYLRQVRIDLPGGVIYRVDFQEFWANGDVIFRDVKGYRTPEYIAKKKQVEACYPITIEEL